MACVCVLFGLLLTVPESADITGKVAAVIDGDTVQVLDDGNVAYAVHLRCADAPELGQEAGVAGAEMLGYESSELVGQSYESILPPIDERPDNVKWAFEERQGMIQATR